MSENLREFVRAVYVFDAVAQRVPDTSWDQPSPCDRWSAREVMGHVVWGVTNTAAMAGGTERPEAQPEADVAGADPLATWNCTRDAVLTAIDQEGVLRKVVTGPFGETTVDDFLGFYPTDLLAHTWDLAAAAGLDAHLPAESCDRVVRNLQERGFDTRRPPAIGPAVAVADDASAADRFAAYLGRDPAFTPTSA